MGDATLTIRVTKEEKQLISKYADALGIGMEEFVRRVVLERIDDEEDIAAFDEAMAEYMANPTPGRTHKEMMTTLE